MFKYLPLDSISLIPVAVLRPHIPFQKFLSVVLRHKVLHDFVIARALHNEDPVKDNSLKFLNQIPGGFIFISGNLMVR